jgi:hypothetical protein
MIHEEMTVAEIVKTSSVSTFQYYRDQQLWYETDNGFLFPVPIDDVGTATFLKSDKTLYMMRYIRKWHEALIKEKQARESAR